MLYDSQNRVNVTVLGNYVLQVSGSVFRSLFVFILATVFIFSAHADDLSGRQIMDEVSARHDRPFEFEEQAMEKTTKHLS